MTLQKKANKIAKENGKKINPEVTKGLKAIQKMHDLCKKTKGSPSKIYIDRRKGK